jgi:hypothetical protein
VRQVQQGGCAQGSIMCCHMVRVARDASRVKSDHLCRCSQARKADSAQADGNRLGEPAGSQGAAPLQH